ncbi:MAG TPA: PadR family transcriptional regulator [Candidatus Woesebacteria bacterium]|nr:PadR family transcriptional regulator [Candidatus Woesebacteria bacterium]HPJ17386.1 PadR family transcriptional regulator [Candidatus Woesebacteria bacterium]
MKDASEQKSQLRKGLLELAVLLVVSRGSVYASDILKQLKDSDLLVVEGTLYPLLSRLKDDGSLGYQWQESKSGPPRKYYQLTKKGESDLSQLLQTWTNLSQSINSLIKITK